MKIKEILEGPLDYLKTFKIIYEDRSGKERIWESVSRGDKDRLEREISGQVYSDGSMIVAWNREKTQLAMVKEFRVAAGHYVYSFPAGLQDDGEEILDSAIREFKEETGLDLRPLGIDGPRYTSIGLSNEKVHTVFGEYSGSLSQDYLEDSEDIIPLLVDKKKALELLEKEDVTIRSAFILRAFFQLPLYEKIK